MVLEEGVASPATRERLLSGPLTDLIEGFYLWLKERQFSTAVLRVHLLNVSFLQEYLRHEHAGGVSRLDIEDIEGFLHIRSANGAGHTMRRFLAYLEEKGLYHAPVVRPHYQPVLDAYTQWLRHYQHPAARTMELRVEYAGLFLDWLGEQATPEGLATLNVRQVEAFCVPFAQRRPGSTHGMSVTLRSFFRFCRHEGYMEQDLTGAVPTVRRYRLDRVPRGFTEEDAQALLASLERRTPVGCRDYAMCLLLHTYGVRGGQVRALRLRDIYWERNEIFFKGVKQGKDSLLPLTVEVGESLLDYLQNGRPQGIRHPEVFLTVKAPYHPLGRAMLTAHISKRARAAGIDAPRCGTHAFRYAFATRMLREGHSLKGIADVLGHRTLQTTFIYTKVDFAALDQVALPWPREGTK